jgi:hypothetical protein
MPEALSASLFKIAPNIRPTPTLRCGMIRLSIRIENNQTLSKVKRP